VLPDTNPVISSAADAIKIFMLSSISTPQISQSDSLAALTERRLSKIAHFGLKRAGPVWLDGVRGSFPMHQLSWPVSSHRDLCWRDIEGHQSGRIACRTADDIRTADLSQDRQSDLPKVLDSFLLRADDVIEWIGASYRHRKKSRNRFILRSRLR
jgi:hypothetical protein